MLIAFKRNYKTACVWFLIDYHLVMEIFLIGSLLGALLGWGIPATVIHQDCIAGDKAACSVEAKINLQHK